MRSLSARVELCLVWITKSAEELVELFNALKLTTPLPFPSVNKWIPAAFVAEEELTFPTANWATVAFAAYAVLYDHIEDSFFVEEPSDYLTIILLAVIGSLGIIIPFAARRLRKKTKKKR